MKRLLVFLLLVASATCLAQASDADIKNLVAKALDRKNKVEKAQVSCVFPGAQPTGVPCLQGFIAGVEVPAGVYALQGGMLCVVPDRNGIGTSPECF